MLLVAVACADAGADCSRLRTASGAGADRSAPVFVSFAGNDATTAVPSLPGVGDTLLAGCAMTAAGVRRAAVADTEAARNGRRVVFMPPVGRDILVLFMYDCWTVRLDTVLMAV